MIGWLRRRREARAAAGCLIEKLGLELAWEEARTSALKSARRAGQLMAWKILRAVEDQLGMERQTDTATRYMK